MSSLHKQDDLPFVKLESLSMMTLTAANKSKWNGSRKALAADGASGGESRSSTPVSGISNGPCRPRSARIAAGGGRRSRALSPEPVVKKTRRIMEDVVDDDECELGLEAVDETEWPSDSNDEVEDDEEPGFVNDELDALADESVSQACSEGTDNASVVSSLAKKVFPRRPKTPDFIFDDVEVPKLSLPESSNDLLLIGSDLMTAFGIYEVLRRFRSIVRLSPFRFEDFCAAVVAGNGDDQSVLLVEIHTTLLRALLREDDGNNTTFGPYDTKDSVAISMHFVDPMTWYECIRMYLDSDLSSTEFRSALHTLSYSVYSTAGTTERLNLLRVLTDLFLGTNAVRQELASEGQFLHDDHCRACHKLGDLLCCDLCPAVYHLACLETPLEEVPEEEWICSVCKAQEVKGVTDCSSEVEKSGLLCRHEPLGYDRHCRKYYFICRRIVVEGELDSEVWYYSTKLQLQNLLEHLDGELYEQDLFLALEELREEIDRQMDITEQLTQELRAGKKSYLDSANEKLRKEFEEKADQAKKMELEEGSSKASEDNGEKSANDTVEQTKDSSSNETSLTVAKESTNQHIVISSEQSITGESVTVSSSLELLPSSGNTAVIASDTGLKSSGSSDAASQNKFTPPSARKMLMVLNKDGSKTVMTIVSSNGKDSMKPGSSISTMDSQDSQTFGADGRKIVTRSKTGSLTPKQFTDSVTVTTGSLKAAVKASLEDSELSRMARNRMAVNAYSATMSSSQYTGLFKLGLENTYRHYQNQYTSNALALNKHQHNEEREKRRHMSHKFSLTPASDFVWSGSTYGLQQTLLNTLRATLLTLETRIPAPFFHQNWPLHRTRWIKMVNACRTPDDFGGVLTMFEASIKPVVFNQVWHEALGHTRLHRTPFLDREETKKKERHDRQETRKKKLDEEEENVCKNEVTWVKYSLGVRHQVWKQRGEEYRINGNGGWLWVSVTRPYRVIPANSVGLRLVAAKLQARKLRQQSNIENADVDVVGCKDSNAADIDAIKRENATDTEADEIKQTNASSTSQVDLDKRLLVNHIVKHELNAETGELTVRMEVQDESSEADRSVPDSSVEKIKDDRTVKEADSADEIKSEIYKVNEMNADKDKAKSKEVEMIMKDDEINSKDDCDRISSTAVFSDDFNISESLLNHTAYPRVTKPYSRLDHLLDRRLALLQTELKQKALCENFIARFRSQTEVNRKRLAPIADVSRSVCTVRTGLTLANVQSLTQSSLTTVRSPLSIMPSCDAKQQCYSSVCRADANMAAHSCYSWVCRQKDKETCDASSVTLSNELCDSGVEDNDDVDKIAEDVTEADSCEIKSTSEPDVNGDTEYKSMKNAAVASTGVEGFRPVIKSSHVSQPEMGLKSIESTSISESSLPAVTASAVPKSITTFGTTSSATASISRAVSPTLSLQKYTQPDGRIQLTATLVEEFEAKLAIFGSTRYKVSLGKRAGPGRPPSKPSAPGTMKTTLAQKKLPPVQRFRGHRGGHRSLFALDRYILTTVARREGKRECPGFNYYCKMNNVGWPYPCPRPYFRTAWRYRCQTLRNMSAAAIHLRVMWACIRWDDLNARVPAAGSGTVTTESDITKTEILKRRDIPPHGLRSEYLVRKIVVPINVPEKPREKYTPQRSGLRERRRAESPKQKEPTVKELWLPEEQLDLWQIKQFSEKLEKQKALEQEQLQKQKLKQQVEALAVNVGMSKSASSISSTSEVAAKLEDQLRQQRLAMAQKRLGVETSQGLLLKPSTPIAAALSTRLQITDIRPKLLPGAVRETPRTALLPLSTAAARSSVSTSTVAVTVNSPAAMSGIRVLQSANGQIQIQPGQQIMRLPDGRQYLLTMATPKSQAQQSLTTLTPGSSLQPPSAMVLGQKIVLTSQANTPQFVVTGNAAGAGTSKSVYVLGATPNSQVLPTLGRPRLVTAVQQQPAIVRMASGQQISLRSVVQPMHRPAVVAAGNLMSTPRSVTVTNDPSVIQSAGYSLLNSTLSPSSEASSSYSVTPQVVQQVLTQALLQTQNPDIQAKLLAMQKQMHLSGVPVVNTNDFSAVGQLSPPLRPVRTPTMMTHDARINKLISSEQKEEQTRSAACVQVMRSLLDTIERRERVEIKRQRKQETVEEKHKRVSIQRLETTLLKHKESLKRNILRKRALLEKEIAAEIQAEISQAVAMQRNMITVTSAPSPVKKRKYDVNPPLSNETSTAAVSMTHGRNTAAASVTQGRNTAAASTMQGRNTASTPPSEAVQTPKKKPGRKRKQELVEVTIAHDKEAADASVQLYCLCKTPYDESKFYIGCDRCEDWFHGSCVGITKCEADQMDSYVCPLCRQRNSNSNTAASAQEASLQRQHFNELRKIVSSLQSHKAGWPFLEPVNASDVPDYYAIIKDPIDLQRICTKVNKQQYSSVSNFVKDVTKMFDNCRYYNAPNSPFYRCAELLEAFFVQKMKHFKATFEFTV